jgi:hypothetical protein
MIAKRAWNRAAHLPFRAAEVSYRWCAPRQTDGRVRFQMAKPSWPARTSSSGRQQGVAFIQLDDLDALQLDRPNLVSSFTPPAPETTRPGIGESVLFVISASASP